MHPNHFAKYPIALIIDTRMSPNIPKQVCKPRNDHLSMKYYANRTTKVMQIHNQTTISIIKKYRYLMYELGGFTPINVL